MIIDTITINGKEYYELTKLNLSNQTYVILTSAESDEFMVRRLVEDNGKTYMEKLNSKEELDSVLKSLKEKIEK